MAKSYKITKQAVWEAYKRVKSNKGGAGVDEQTIEDFEKDLKNNLYKIWNRMSSGSYIPPAVLLVEIPKKDGGKRPLGIPTVSDRVAQMVAKQYLEPELEPCFHEDSYGYRPDKSALQAVAKTRERCWEHGWVLDLDIKGFFDNLNHELLMRAVKKHTQSKWLILYIERWLKSPLKLQNGDLLKRDKGTPQGGVISPLLANLYLHYVFDIWMTKHHPEVKFERFADDIICHCRTKYGAMELLSKLKQRFAACYLEIHPQKSQVVYCKSYRYRGEYENISFDFLGYTFKPRAAVRESGSRKVFQGFTPAVSRRAMKSITSEIRSWRVHRRTDKSLEDLGNMFNPVIRGWLNYYGKYNKMELGVVFRRLDDRLTRLIMKKHKRLRGHKTRAGRWLQRYMKQYPHTFAHWKFFHRI